MNFNKKPQGPIKNPKTLLGVRFRFVVRPEYEPLRRALDKRQEQQPQQVQPSHDQFRLVSFVKGGSSSAATIT
jgi:hypothetical protein